MNAEDDLRWYYRESADACGIRSPLGRQLEMVRCGLVPVGSSTEPWIRPCDVERAARIRRRLLDCAVGTRRTLELQFASPSQVRGVSLHLAAAQRCVSPLFNSARRKLPHLTRPQWILWLAMRSQLGHRNEGDILEKICTSAQKALKEALWEYGAT